MGHLGSVRMAAGIVLLLLATASVTTGQTLAARVAAPAPGLSLSLNEYANSVRLTRTSGAAPVFRSLSGGEKIAIGAGVGFAVLATPVYIGMKDPSLAAAAGVTGALLGAAIVYKLLQ